MIKLGISWFVFVEGPISFSTANHVRLLNNIYSKINMQFKQHISVSEQVVVICDRFQPSRFCIRHTRVPEMVTKSTFCCHEICGPHVVALLKPNTYIWIVYANIVVKNWHLKDTSYDEIGLCVKKINHHKFDSQCSCDQQKRKTLCHKLPAHFNTLHGLSQHLCGASIVSHPLSYCSVYLKEECTY